MYCYKCGKESAESRYCRYCGADQAYTGAGMPRGASAPHCEQSSIKSWETSVGFSILGAVASVVFSAIFGYVLFAVETYLIAMLVYLFGAYRSYFTAKPWLSSSKAISFFNLFFGSIIFGCLFNGNLTKGTRGISYIVLAVFCIIAVIIYPILIVTYGVLLGMMLLG